MSRRDHLEAGSALILGWWTVTLLQRSSAILTKRSATKPRQNIKFRRSRAEALHWNYRSKV
jgi:hypothetical protein